MARSRKKKTPFQPLATELETVAAAVGVQPSQVSNAVLQGLAAGLAQTTSPLKDAVEHLLQIRELGGRYKILTQQLHGILCDVERQIRTKSATVPIDWHTEREQEILTELQDVLFRLI